MKFNKFLKGLLLFPCALIVLFIFVLLMKLMYEGLFNYPTITLIISGIVLTIILAIGYAKDDAVYTEGEKQ